MQILNPYNEAILAKSDEVVRPQVTLESFDNHIYFYATVERDRCLETIRLLHDLDARLRAERISRKSAHVVPIWLHVNSFGGSLFDGLNMIDVIQSLETPVYSVVEGVAASAATLLTMACEKRYIQKRSFMMIHQLWTWFVGLYEEFKDEKVVLDKLMETMVAFYKEHSNLKTRKIRSMLKRNTWLDAEEAIAFGLVDGYIDETTLRT